MVKTISAEMTTLINGEVLTLATCWKLSRTDGVELFITDHDADIVFAGDTYIAASGIARTAIESKADLSVDNLDIVGIFGGIFTRNDLDAGFYDFATIDIFSVNWQDPDGAGALQHRFGTIGEMETKDGGYTTEMRGMMQLLERRRGKVWSPDCRADLYSPLVNAFSGRSDGCGIAAAAFEEFGVVAAVTDDRKYTVGEFSRLSLVPEYAGAFGEVVGVHEVDGKVEMVLTVADKSPMRPTIITTLTEVNNVADDLYGHSALRNDIDATGAFTPLGNDADPFRGTFDGRGYSIRNYTVDTGGTAPAGLFGVCTGMIRRLVVENTSVKSGSATEWAGTLCGRLLGIEASEHPLSGGGRIEQCAAVGGDLTTDGDFAGGLIGEVGDGTIVRETWTAVEIIGTIGTDVGAIVGRTLGSTVVASGNFANTDAAGTTDLGNGATAGYIALLDAAWHLQASFSVAPAWDFNDREIMNAVASTGITMTFLAPRSMLRSAGSFWDDGIRPEDDITIVGSVSNDGTYRIRSVGDTGMTLSDSETVVNEFTPVAVTITTVGGPRPLDPGRF